MHPCGILGAPFAEILSGRDIFSQNRSAIPSFYCAAHGFVTIPTDRCGDAIALDVTDAHVYLLSHEKYEEDGIHPGWNADHTAFLPPVKVSRQSIVDTAEGEWESIEAFLDDCLERLVTE